MNALKIILIALLLFAQQEGIAQPVKVKNRLVLNSYFRDLIWSDPDIYNLNSRPALLNDNFELQPFTDSTGRLLQEYLNIFFVNSHLIWIDSAKSKVISINTDGRIDGPFRIPAGERKFVKGRQWIVQIQNKIRIYQNIGDQSNFLDIPLSISSDYSISTNGQKFAAFGRGKCLIGDLQSQVVYDSLEFPLNTFTQRSARFLPGGTLLMRKEVNEPEEWHWLSNSGERRSFEFINSVPVNLSDSVFLLFKQDSLLFFSDVAPIKKLAFAGDQKMIKNHFTSFAMGYEVNKTEGDSLIYISLYHRGEQIIDNKSSVGIYKINLKTGSTMAAQSPGFPNFPNHKVIIKDDKAYWIGNTAKDGTQVLQYNFKEKTTKRLTNFLFRSLPLNLIQLSDEIFVQGTTSTETGIFKLDRSYHFPLSEPGNETAYQVYPPYRLSNPNEAFPLLKAFKQDAFGNSYHAMFVPFHGNVYLMQNGILKNLYTKDSVINPLNLLSIEKFGRDGKLIWSKQFKVAPPFSSLQIDLDINEQGKILITGTSAFHFFHQDIEIRNDARLIPYLMVLDSLGNPVQTYVANGLFTSFSDGRFDKENNIIFGARSDSWFGIGGKEVRPKLSIPFYTVNKIFNDNKLAWSTELNILNLKYRPAIEHSLIDNINRNVIVILNELDEYKDIQGGPLNNPIVSKIYCLSSENGSVLWEKTISSPKGYQMRWRNMIDFNDELILLFGHYSGSITFETKLLDKNQDNTLKPALIYLNKKTGLVHQFVVLDKPGFYSIGVGVNEKKELYISTYGRRLVDSVSLGFVDYEKYTWSGKLLQRKSLRKSGVRDWWEFINKNSSNFIVKNNEEILVSETPNFLGWDTIAYSNPHIYSPENRVLFSMRFDHSNDNHVNIQYGQSILYPNPGNGVFTVKSDDFSDSSSVPVFEIFNMLGQKISFNFFNMNKSEYTFNLTNAPIGQYYLIYSLAGKAKSKAIKFQVR